jgi:hypothetical protein
MSGEENSLFSEYFPSVKSIELGVFSKSRML